MKILHLIYDHIDNPWVGGGGAVRVYEIYKRLSSHNQITVVCGRYPSAADYSEGNLKFHFTGTERGNYVLSVFWYVLESMEFLKKYADEYDVVVEDFTPYTPLFSFLRHRKTMIQLHQKEGFHHLKKYFILGLPFITIELLYPRLFRNAVLVSEICKRKFRLTGNTVIIPNGIDPILLAEEVEDGDYFLFLGRLHVNQKGLDILLSSLSYLKTDIRLVIAGRGREEARVRQMFGKYMSSGRVRMVGFVTGRAKMDYLRKCKFLVVPSRYEAQCIGVLEAAASGKPVLVSDVPELSYSVNAGFGLSFRTGDAKDLAYKIKLLFGNESLRMDMSRKAREFAKGYVWDNIAADFEQYLVAVSQKG